MVLKKEVNWTKRKKDIEERIKLLTIQQRQTQQLLNQSQHAGNVQNRIQENQKGTTTNVIVRDRTRLLQLLAYYQQEAESAQRELAHINAQLEQERKEKKSSTSLRTGVALIFGVILIMAIVVIFSSPFWQGEITGSATTEGISQDNSINPHVKIKNQVDEDIGTSIATKNDDGSYDVELSTESPRSWLGISVQKATATIQLHGLKIAQGPPNVATASMMETTSDEPAESAESTESVIAAASTVSPLLKIDIATETKLENGEITTPVIVGENIQVASAVIRLPKNGNVNHIMRCATFESATFSCPRWEVAAIPFIDHGDSIEFTVGGFSAYAGGDIVAIDAVHLDADYVFMSNIFEQVKTKDEVWSEAIAKDEFVRVTFERDLTNGRVIDLYARSSGQPAHLDIYEAGTTHLVGQSGEITEPGWQYITVNNLQAPHDQFDFKMVAEDPTAAIEFDYIHDNFITSAQADGMIMYGALNNASPIWRLWNQTYNFSAINRGQGLGANGTNDIQWVVLRGSWKRDEMIMGTQDAASDINFQIFNNSDTGSKWQQVLRVTDNVASPTRRAFDIAYEELTGDALLVYENNSPTDQQIQYQLWNGTRYSAVDNFTVTDPTGATLGSTPIYNILAFPKLRSDDIMILAVNSSSSAPTGLLAALFNGTGVLPSNTLMISNRTDFNIRPVWQYGWESLSGEGIAVWGQKGLLMRTYSTSAGWGQVAHIANLTAGSPTVNGLRLCSNPSSDYIGIIWIDSNLRVNVSMWNGSEILNSTPTISDGAAGPANGNVNMDCAFFNQTSALFGFIAKVNVPEMFYFTFSEINSWNTTTMASASLPNITLSAVTNAAIKGLKFTRHPSKNEVMIVTQDASGDTYQSLWYGNQTPYFHAIGESPVETYLEVTDGGAQAVWFDWFRYDPKPNVTDVRPTLNSAATAGNDIEISANVTDNLLLQINSSFPVQANITFPNGTNLTFILSNSTAGAPSKFNLTFTIPSAAMPSSTGVYTVTFFANDSRNSLNWTEKTNFTVSAASSDTTPPNITQLLPVANTAYNTSMAIEIGANYTDPTSASAVQANITYPNNSMIPLTLSLATVGAGWPVKYNTSFQIPQRNGFYSITFQASDTNNNFNTTERTNFTAALACGELRWTVNMSQNITSTGTCFTVNASNIALDCFGYQINYSTAGTLGYGINNTGFTNVTIKNCVINEGTSTTNGKYAILWDTAATNGTIYNNTIITTGTAGANAHSAIRIIAASDRANISHNIIQTRGDNTNGIHLFQSGNHTVYQNIIQVAGSSTIGLFAVGITIDTSGNNVVELNNITTSSTSSLGIRLMNSLTNGTQLINNNISTGGNFVISDTTGPGSVNSLIYNDTFGLINWTSGNLTTNMSLAITSSIFIANRTIGVIDNSRIMNLNGTAKIQMRWLPYIINPHVLKAGNRCDGTIFCNFTYAVSTGVLDANVSSFSNYTTNGAPTQNTPILNTTDPTTNNTNQNLTLYPQNGSDDDTGTNVKNITNWRINGTSLTALLMPFEGINSTFVNNAVDYSGYSNNGTESGSIVWSATAGYDGRGAYIFDAFDDALNITDANSLDLTTPFSIVFWLNARNVTPANFSPLMMKGAGPTMASWNYAVILTTSSLINITISGAAGVVSSINTSAPIINNTWYHVAAVYNTTFFGIYINGILNSSFAAPILPASNIEPLRIGGWSVQVLNGTIDDMVIYNRSLTSQQITALYNNRTDLMTSWELSSGQNWTADVTPNDGRMDGTILRSNQVIVTAVASGNNLPTAPLTLMPANGSGITNRTPTFTWNNATDADGNIISYHLQVDDNILFNNPEINISAIQNTIFNSANTSYFSAGGVVELNVDTRYYWRVRANDSTGYGAWSDGSSADGLNDGRNLSNFTVNSLLSITMTNNLIEFGTLSQGVNTSTVTGNPRPFRAENVGNIDFNVSINASPFFSSVMFNTSYYQFKIRANESNAFSAALSTISFTNMSNRTTAAHVVNLTWRDARNDFLTDINITLPFDEPFGLKESTVTLTITANQ